MVLPVALYGAETWARIQNDNSKLTAFEMKCLRRILDIKREEKVSNAKIKEKINHQLSKDRPDIIKRFKTRQTVWFGHVTRMEETRLPNIVMCEKIQDTNKQGRPLEIVNLSEEAAAALAQ